MAENTRIDWARRRPIPPNGRWNLRVREVPW